MDEFSFPATEKILAPSLLFAFPGKEDLVQPGKFILVNDICTIGRSSQCDVVIQAKTVSRLHAKVERSGPRYILYDMHSANGTFVNGRRLRETHLLAANDEIGLGQATPLLFFVDADPTEFITSQLRYEAPTMTFFLNDKPLDLSSAQFRLLSHLYQHAGDLCTRESCAEALWGREYEPGLDADALDRAVSNLRRKLREVGVEAELIRTARGLGYILDP